MTMFAFMPILLILLTKYLAIDGLSPFSGMCATVPSEP